MGETESENPEYAVTKGIIQNLSKEIAAARKKLKTQQQQQGKGKRKIILADSSEDEEELATTTLDIIEDAAANKVPVKTQLQRFVDAGAQVGRPKKAKTTMTSENFADLVLMPPPPSPTKITKEQVPAPQSVNPLDLCKSAMMEAVKTKVNRDRDL